MELLVVSLIVLGAAAFIARRIWATAQAARNAKAGCVDCGCETKSSSSADWSKS